MVEYKAFYSIRTLMLIPIEYESGYYATFYTI